jgi:hypothetical protein
VALNLPAAAGATVGKMPCLAISASVTAYGRQMIMHTREMVTTQFCRANGYEADCDVIYGDTDSVMVNFRVGGPGLGLSVWLVWLVWRCLSVWRKAWLRPRLVGAACVARAAGAACWCRHLVGD